MIQNKVARLGLGANSFVATEALKGEMGWSNYEERVSRMKVNYKVKLKLKLKVLVLFLKYDSTERQPGNPTPRYRANPTSVTAQ